MRRFHHAGPESQTTKWSCWKTEFGFLDTRSNVPFVSKTQEMCSKTVLRWLDVYTHDKKTFLKGWSELTTPTFLKELSHNIKESYGVLRSCWTNKIRLHIQTSTEHGLQKTAFSQQHLKRKVPLRFSAPSHEHKSRSHLRWEKSQKCPCLKLSSTINRQYER